MSLFAPTFVALLTPPGRGAVATFLVQGPQAVTAVEGCFQPAARNKRLSQFPIGRIVFGRWGGIRGEEIIVCRTANDRLELSCHGGCVAASRIQADLQAAGCRNTTWQESVLNDGGANDRVKAEAMVALAHARTQRTAAILLDQMHGALSRELDQVRHLASHDAPQAQNRLRALLDRAPLGMHLTTPWRVVLAGPPNVGKSSLINALLGYQRAIVFDEPGTTRDVVTATTAVEGWPVELSDTAGLRDSADALEAAGVALSQAQMAAADALILVFDGSQPWSDANDRICLEWPRAILVLNKCDLPSAASGKKLPHALCVSALLRHGIDALVHRVANHLVPAPPSPGSAVPHTVRQIEQIQARLDALRRASATSAAGTPSELRP